MPSQFLFNAALWHELGTRIPKANKVCAAVAYLGTGGATLLPLRKGDVLIVDMSLARVRAGTTDPKEVRKLLKKGVSVFSRGSLHAKFLIIDNVVIAGSSNVSSHAKNDLDEAAVLTDDIATVRRARSTFKELCTEPVRKDYLAKCIEEYRPPKTTGSSSREKRKSKGNKLIQSKLWFIAGLRYRELPQSEVPSAGKLVEQASRKLLDFQQSEVDYIHYPSNEVFFTRLRKGDWVIQCIKYGKGYDAFPPERFLGVDHYSRGKGKRRYLLLFEKPLGAEATPWRVLRARSLTPLPAKPRRGPVSDDADADAVLRMWDARGKFRKKAR